MRKHYPLNSSGDEDAGQMPWTDGVPSTGTEGSYFGHALFTDAEAEILSAIDASGQTRNGSDLTQLVQAFARGIYLGQFSGTANALTAALPNNVVFASLLRGIRFTGFVTATNTAGVTVALAGIGPVTAPATVTAPLLRKNGTALQSGDLPVGQDFEIRWDGSAFRFVGTVTSDTAAVLAGGKAFQNVKVIPITGRTVLSGSVSGTLTPAFTFSYQKALDTSLLVVIPNIILFSTAANVPVTTRFSAGTATPVDTFAQCGYINSSSGQAVALANTGAVAFDGLLSGTVAGSVACKRDDNLSWSCALNPNNTDFTGFAGSTKSFLIAGEVAQ